MGTEIQPTSPDVKKPLDITSDITEVAKVETDLRTFTTQLEAGALSEATGVKETYMRALQIANGELPEDATAEVRAEQARLRVALDQFSTVVRALKGEPATSSDGSEPVVVRDGKLVYASDAGPEPDRKNRLVFSDTDPTATGTGSADGVTLDSVTAGANSGNEVLNEILRQDAAARRQTESDTSVVPPKEEEGGGDDDEGEIVQTAEVVEGEEVEAEVVTDPYAERNAASTAIIDKLSEGNFSVGGNVEKGRMDAIRGAITGHVGEKLAARFDTDGNIVIGVPQTEGSYLRSRVITIDAKQDAGIVDWIKSLSKETVLLRETQYTVPVEKNPTTTV